MAGQVEWCQRNESKVTMMGVITSYAGVQWGRVACPAAFAALCFSSLHFVFGSPNADHAEMRSVVFV